MTLQQLINKYTNIAKDYDSIFLTQVLDDLYQIKKSKKPRKRASPEELIDRMMRKRAAIHLK